MHTAEMMDELKKYKTSSEVAIPNCSVVIRGAKCPLCLKNFKCLSDVRFHKTSQHGIFQHNQQIEKTVISNTPNSDWNETCAAHKKVSKDERTQRGKGRIHVILRIGNEVMSNISLKRKYLKEHTAKLITKRRCLKDGHHSINKENCSSHIIKNNDSSTTYNFEYNNEVQVPDNCLPCHGTVADVSSLSKYCKSNIVPKNESLGGSELLEKDFSMQLHKYSNFGDESNQGKANNKENKFKRVGGDTKVTEKTSVCCCCRKHCISGHCTVLLSENIQLPTKKSPYYNATEQEPTKTNNMCLGIPQDNLTISKDKNKLQMIESTRLQKNETTSTDSSLYCKRIANVRRSTMDIDVKEILTCIRKPVYEAKDTQAETTHDTQHRIKGRMLLWDAIKQMRNMDCYMTESEKFARDNDVEYVIIDREAMFQRTQIHSRHTGF